MFDQHPTPYDVCFTILGYPVRVHPFFWLIIALLGMSRTIDNMALWLVNLAIWVGAAFLSILIHELGHASVFRHIYGVSSRIVFHGMGGVTIPNYPHQRYHGFKGFLCELLLFASGPLAGFVLAAVAIFFLTALTMSSDASLFEEGFGNGSFSLRWIVIQFFWSVAAVSIFWGIFNLLPIYPMDGGQISREIFSYFSPRNGVANSLILSMVVAILVGLLTFRLGMVFVTILFAFFAYQNYQEMSFRSFRRW